MLTETAGIVMKYPSMKSTEGLQDAVNELLQNNDVVITCGGIGPTEDDFTKEVISEMFNLKLVVDEDHLSWMKSRWESRGMTMPATNVKQAEIPAGATKLIAGGNGD